MEKELNMKDLILTLKDKAFCIRKKSGEPGKYYSANIGYEDADIYDQAADTIQALKVELEETIHKLNMRRSSVREDCTCSSIGIYCPIHSILEVKILDKKVEE